MPARHDLAWLSSAGWDAAVLAASPDQRSVLARWRAACWPATVRRPDADAAPGEVCLGITPPPSGGARVRLGLRCSQAHVARLCRPLALSDAAPALPQQWRAAYSDLQRRAAAAGLDMRVYGSLALQALTGQPYLTAQSDIDLALFPAHAQGLAAGVALLDDCAARLPLDGEIVFPSGWAVAWKEWRSAAADHGCTRVLAKSMQSVALLAPRQLLEELDQPDELAEPACWR